MSRKKTSSAARPAAKSKLTTMQAVARSLGIDRGTLENWRAEGCPGLPPAAFDEKAVKEWAARNNKRATGSCAGDLRAQKTAEEIRKLKLRNDRDAGKLIERAEVVERFARFSARVNAFRLKSETEHPLRLDAAPDVAGKREILREIWAEIFTEHQKALDEFN